MLLLAAAGGLALAGVPFVGVTFAQPAPMQGQTPASRPGSTPVEDPDAPMADTAVEPDPAVKPLLDEMRAAYTGLQSLDLAGSVTADFDAAGQKNNEVKKFTAAFKAPNQFVHELPDELTVVGTGKQIFLYDPTQNVYLKQPSPQGRLTVQTLPPPVVAILQSQNVSLFLALSDDPVGLLSRGADTISAAPAVSIDGTDYPAVAVQTEGNAITLALDPETKLVRRMTVDLSPTLKAQGIAGVNKAIVTIDYSKSEAGADLAAGRFDFAPPAGATDLAAARPQGAQGAQGAQGMNPAGGPQGGPATAPSGQADPSTPRPAAAGGDTGMPQGTK